MRLAHVVPIILGMLLTTCLFSGCSKPGGGVDSVVAVTLKPSALPLFSGSKGNGGGDANGSGKSSGSKSDGKPGSLRGRILIEGTIATLPPLLAKGARTKDAICSTEAVPNESLQIKNGGLQNVFIYLQKSPRGAKFSDVSSDDKLKFTNRGCRFLPHAMAIRTKQVLMVTNDDPIAHNTHTEPARNQQFNEIIQPGKPKGEPLIYAKAEKIPVKVKCDFHSWMKAYQLPLDHPFVAVTDAEGNFEIPNLPAGKHKFTIWHEAKGYLSRGHVVVIDGDQYLDIPYPAATLSQFEGPRPKRVLLSMSSP